MSHALDNINYRLGVRQGFPSIVLPGPFSPAGQYNFTPSWNNYFGLSYAENPVLSLSQQDIVIKSEGFYQNFVKFHCSIGNPYGAGGSSYARIWLLLNGARVELLDQIDMSDFGSNGGVFRNITLKGEVIVFCSVSDVLTVQFELDIAGAVGPVSTGNVGPSFPIPVHNTWSAIKIVN